MCIRSGPPHEWRGTPKMIHTGPWFTPSAMYQKWSTPQVIRVYQKWLTSQAEVPHHQRYNTLMVSCSSGDSLTIHKVMLSWKINYTWINLMLLSHWYSQAVFPKQFSKLKTSKVFPSRYLATSRVYFWYCVWEGVGLRRFGLGEPVSAKGSKTHTEHKKKTIIPSTTLKLVPVGPTTDPTNQEAVRPR